jgi:hypothetical protein
LVSLATWRYFETPILTLGNRLASIVERPVLAVPDQKTT